MLITTIPLRVFVAKSFREEDKQRTSPIEALIDSFAKLGVQVETGEPSEPESISKKVRDRIDRASVFVGIFTRRFPVCRTTGRFRTAWDLILRQPTAWSAPPWVLQEFGYAIAKNRDLILFAEANVDLGGLEGDCVCIPYDHRNPAPAITMASSMLNGLIAKHLGASVQTSLEVTHGAEVKHAPSVEPLPINSNTLASNETEPDALKATLFDLLDALGARDFDCAERLFQAGRKHLEEENKHELALTWAIFYYSHLVKAGRSDSLDKLRELSSAHSNSPQILKAMADCLMSYGEFEQAGAELDKASRLSEVPYRYEIELQRGTCLLKAGKNDEAVRLLLRTARTALDASSDFRSRLMMELFSTFKASDQLFLGLGIAEAGLSENPASATLRFKLSNDYSDAQCFALGALHVKTLVHHNATDSASAHNLAVAYHNLALPIASVSQYKRALGLGETLSANNMAYKLLNAGFAEECETMLRNAMLKIDCVSDVRQALGELYRRQQDEEEKLGSLLDGAAKQRDLMIRVGDGILSDSPVDVGGIWTNGFGTVSFEASGTGLVGHGEKLTEGMFLSNMFSAPPTGTCKTQHIWKLEGKLFGRVCKFHLVVTSSPEGQLISNRATEDGYIIFGSSCDKGEVVRLNDGQVQVIEVIHKTQPSEP